MDLDHMLGAVRNDAIQFVTMRPPESRFASLERRVVVTGPPELVELSRTAQLAVLDALIELLKEPGRRWAAVVLLAAMTRREEKIVDIFAQSPGDWLESLGKQANERWAAWLKDARDKLRWDPKQKMFIEAAG